MEHGVGSNISFAMAKSGTYNVQNIEDGKPAVQDTSYKSCLCIMLIFISFCALVILFSTITFGNGDKQNSNKDTETFKDGYHGNQFEKIQSSTTYPKATTQRTTTTPRKPTSTTHKSPLSSQKPTPTPREPTPIPQKPTPNDTEQTTKLQSSTTSQKPTSTTHQSLLSSQKPTTLSTINNSTKPNEVTTVPPTTKPIIGKEIDNDMEQTTKLQSSITYSKATTHRTTTTSQKSPLSSQKPTPIPREPTAITNKPEITKEIENNMEHISNASTTEEPMFHIERTNETYKAITNATPPITTQKLQLTTEKAQTPSLVTTQKSTSIAGDDGEKSIERTHTTQQETPTTVSLPAKTTKQLVATTPVLQNTTESSRLSQIEKTTEQPAIISTNQPTSSSASTLNRNVHIVNTIQESRTEREAEETESTTRFLDTTESKGEIEAGPKTSVTDDSMRTTQKSNPLAGDDMKNTTERNETQEAIMQAKITSTPKQETPTTIYLSANTTKQLVSTTYLSTASQTENGTEQPEITSTNQPPSSSALTFSRNVHIVNTTQESKTEQETTTPAVTTDVTTIGTEETESTTHFLNTTTESKGEIEAEPTTTVKDDSMRTTQKSNPIAGDDMKNTTERNETQEEIMQAKITSTPKQETPTTVYLSANTTTQLVSTTYPSTASQTENGTEQPEITSTNQQPSSSASTLSRNVHIVNTTQESKTEQETTTPAVTTDVTTVGTEETESTTHFLNTTTESKGEIEAEPTTTVKDTMNKTTVVQPEPMTTRRTFQRRTKVQNSKNKPTSQFKSAVSRMLNLMGHSQDPCEDFYMYSCGGAGAARMPVENSADDATWNSLLRQLNDVDTTDASDVPFAKLKTFHKSCIEHEATFNYKERLEQVESILEGEVGISNATITVDDLTRLIAKMVQLKSLPIMEVNVGVDTDSTYVFELSPPYRSLTQDDVQRWSTLFKIDMHCLKHTKYDQRASTIDLNKVYQQFTNCKKHYSSYLDSFNITTQAFDDLANVDGLMWSVDNEILNFTTSAYSITTLRDAIISKLPTAITISELNTKFRAINWELFFKLLSGRPHASDTKIHIYLQDALFKIFDEFANMQRRHFYNYLYAIYANDIYQNVIIPKAIEHREEYCVKLSTYLFGDVFSYLYMKALPSDVIQTSKKLVHKVFDELKKQLIHAIEGQDWLKGPRVAMVTTANSLSCVFQQKDDNCISKDYLKKKYGSLLLDDTFGANYVRMVAYKNEEKFRTAGIRFSEKETFCNIARPFDRSPSSLYSTPVIAIPYGMVHSWSLDYPSYFVMGKVGIKIAMEILRYFDPVGIRSFILGDDADESYELLKYHKHSEKIPYENKKFALKISSESNYQNIRDNAALRLTYSVFNNLSSASVQDLPFVKDDFKEEEVFLISMAQEFCENLTPLEYMLRVYEGLSLPNYWRVNKMVVTSRRFKDFYHCKQGANLNPTDEEFHVFPDEISSGDQYESDEVIKDYTGGL